MRKRITDLANSPRGRQLADKAKQIANDPKTREQIDNARRKLSERRKGGSSAGPGGPKAA